MKRYIDSLLSFAVSLLVVSGLSSCTDMKQSPFDSTGKSREMIVVLPVNETEADTLKEFSKEVFNEPVPLLPQPEASVDLSFTLQNNFTTIFKAYRNILIYDIDPNRYTQGVLRLSRNVWAKGQNVYTAQSPDLVTAKALIRLQAPKIMEEVYRSDVLRHITDLERTYSSKFAKEVEKYIGEVTINAPVEMKWTRVNNGFVWATDQGVGNRGRMDMVVYTFPYTDVNTFETSYLIHKRDSIMRQWMPGEYKDSYMQTEHRADPMAVKGEVNGTARVILRGLWNMHGDMMGGPFVMHAMVHPNGKEVLVAEAFVYAPEVRKKRLMLLNESALYTLRLAGDKIEYGKLFPKAPVIAPYKIEGEKAQEGETSEK
ncbi:DUF4837 family protein [Porphyromonas canoris]|uniref:DUF4837 family protein n=1 Tax=Porphyromonas canoris TaxID=36875 RepID=UPI0006913673|nr:DUF4837 family protein [Porphyromonas canoris]